MIFVICRKGQTLDFAIPDHYCFYEVGIVQQD